MTFEEDLAAEGEPHAEAVAGIAARLPAKPMAAGAVFHDESGRVLVVSPIYKPGWDLPGGVVEAGEAPGAACAREVQEELGLSIGPGPLLVVDWVPGRGPWRDSLQFLFDGGLLSDDDVPHLALQTSELSAARLATLDEIAAHALPSLHRRLTHALAALHEGGPRYLEFGRPR